LVPDFKGVFLKGFARKFFLQLFDEFFFRFDDFFFSLDDFFFKFDEILDDEIFPTFFF